MRVILVIFSTVFILSVLTRCCPTKHLSTNTTDSVRIEVKERVVKVTDTVTLTIDREVEKNVTLDSTSYLENKVAKSRAIVSDGVLTHSLESKPQDIAKPVEAEIIVKDSIVYKDREITNIVEVPRELTWWQRIRLNGFWVLLGIIAIFVAFKFGRLV